MEYETKTTYFGTPRTLTEAGRRELLDEFRNGYHDQENIPFVAYDDKQHVFSMTTDNKLAVLSFLLKLQEIVNHYIANPPGYDDAAKLEALSSSDPSPEESVGDEPDGRKGQLIDISNDFDVSDEEAQYHEDYLIWKPRCGSISILDTVTAKRISDDTNTFLSPELDGKQIRLINGAPINALQKLKNLEPMLEAIARHRVGTASILNSTHLCLSSKTAGIGVKFAPMSDKPQLSRVMVAPSLEAQIGRMLIAEEYIFNPTDKKFRVRENLRIVEAPPQVGPSTIWLQYELAQLGPAENANPQTVATLPSVMSDTHKRLADPGRNLQPAQRERLKEWTRGVDEDADPTVAAAQPAEPVYEEIVPTARRILEEDSDEEEKEEKSIDAAAKVLLESDSDDSAPSASKTTSRIKPIANDSQQTVSRSKEMFQLRSKELTRNIAAPRANNLVQSSRIQARLRTNSSFYADVPTEDKDQGQDDEIPGSPLSTRQLKDSPRKTQTPLETASKYRDRLRSYNGVNSNDIARENEVKEVNPSPRHYFLPTAQTRLAESEVSKNPVGMSSLNPNKRGAFRAAQHTAARPTILGADPQEDGWRTASSKKGGQKRATLLTQHDSWLGRPPQPVPAVPHAQPSSHIAERMPKDLTLPNTQNLVDVSIQIHDGRMIRPPPGFELRSPDRPRTISSSQQNLLDSSLDNIQRPSIRPQSLEAAYVSEDTSHSASYSSGKKSTYDFREVHKPHKPRVDRLTASTLAHLANLRPQDPPPIHLAQQASAQREIISEDEEISSRKFYNTMNLQANNPGKRGKKQAPKQKNMTKVMPVLEKPDPIHPVSTRSAKALKDDFVPSKRLRNIAKNNPELATLHTSALNMNVRHRQASSLFTELESAFEAARAFSGQVELEVQLGQVLFKPAPSRISDDKVYEHDKLASLFGENGLDACFTNIVTVNGLEIDDLLHIKTHGNPMWLIDEPGRHLVEIIFDCRDKAGLGFSIVLTQDGGHKFRRKEVVLHKSGLVCANQIQDACFVLKGRPKWYEDDTEACNQLINGAAKLLSSVHVKSGPLAEVYYRLPDDNSITIQNVCYRRTSLHSGNPACADNFQDLQLKVIEIKLLQNKTHPQDKKLYCAKEDIEYAIAIPENRVHYEISVVHRKISAAFASNTTLKIGELTHKMSSDIFNLQAVRATLDASLTLISQIDWVGSQNFGTLDRLYQIKRQRESDLLESRPLTSLKGLQRSQPMAAARSIYGPRTNVPASTQPGTTTFGVPGIRQNERARTWVDLDGRRIQLGLGGARIPVPRGTGAKGSDNIVPGDSASQAGDPRMRSTQTQTSQNIMGGYDQNEDGYW